jgi:hypothetical protein
MKPREPRQKPRKPPRQTRIARTRLLYVIDFLNRKDFEGPNSPWAVYISGDERNRSRLKKRIENFQRELRKEVEAALQPPRQAGLRKLAEKVEKLQTHRSIVVELLARSSRVPIDFPVLDFGDEKFIVDELIAARGNTCESAVYSYIDDALRTGRFAWLKKCRQCSKFFASYRRGAFACGPKCNAEFHNAEARSRGYFQTYYQQQKNRRLALARRLARANTPVNVIAERTGLTKLALRREGILEE